MSNNNADFIVDLFCVPLSWISINHITLEAGITSFTGSFFMVLGMFSTFMIIVVNMDKFIEKVKKYFRDIYMKISQLKRKYFNKK